jgi:hypothetical protein
MAAHRAVMPILSAGADARAGALTAVGVVAFGAVTTGRRRCLAYAAAAGMAYGLVSVYVHSLAVDGLDHVHMTAVVGLIAALPVGLWFVQHAYAAGPPQVVIACQTVIDPMLGVGVGLGLFGEATALPRSAAVVLLAGAAIAVVGVVLLAREHIRPQWSRS